jgi:hypothetical protein
VQRRAGALPSRAGHAAPRSGPAPKRTRLALPSRPCPDPQKHRPDETSPDLPATPSRTEPNSDTPSREMHTIGRAPLCQPCRAATSHAPPRADKLSDALPSTPAKPSTTTPCHAWTCPVVPHTAGHAQPSNATLTQDVPGDDLPCRPCRDTPCPTAHRCASRAAPGLAGLASTRQTVTDHDGPRPASPALPSHAIHGRAPQPL